MSEAVEQKSRAEANSRPNWSAVFAVAFCVACLITVEFLPVSLLTPMAQDLGISEGVAGQSVTVSQKLITANVPDVESAQRSVLLRLFFNLYDLVDAKFNNAPAFLNLRRRFFLLLICL